MKNRNNQKKIYAIGNLVVILLLIFWSYISNVTGINGNTVATLSDKYATLFTPAAYAFSMWGLIFLSLLAHCFFQIKTAFFSTPSKKGDYILDIGPWLIIANIGTIAWLWFWLTDVTWLSVIIIVSILASLLRIIIKLNMEHGTVSASIRRSVWFPISIYSGWITIAVIANVSAYLVKIEWTPFLSESTWAIIMMLIATTINLMMIGLRNMRVFAAIGFWGLIAIAVKHWDTIPLLQWTALSCAFVLFVAIFFSIFKPSTQTNYV